MRYPFLALLLACGCEQNPQPQLVPKPPPPAYWAVGIYVDVTTVAEPGRLKFVDALECALVTEQRLGGRDQILITKTLAWEAKDYYAKSGSYEGRADKSGDIKVALRGLWQSQLDPDVRNLFPPSGEWWHTPSDIQEFGGISRVERFLASSEFRSRRRVLIIWGDPKIDTIGEAGRWKRLLDFRQWRFRYRADPPETHVYGPDPELHRFLKDEWKEMPRYCFHPPGDRFDPEHIGWYVR